MGERQVTTFKLRGRLEAQLLFLRQKQMEAESAYHLSDLAAEEYHRLEKQIEEIEDELAEYTN